MPGKKSAKSRSSSSKSRGTSGKKKGKKSAKSSRGSAKSRPSTTLTEVREPDMLDPPAMDNLYYICHGASDALDVRGFGWPAAGSSKKKKGKKGKKKK